MSAVAAKAALNRVRNWMWKLRCPYIIFGEDFHLQWDAKIFAPHRVLRFGHHVGINSACTINTDMVCGNHVLVAANVGFVARDSHTYKQPGLSIWDSPRGDTLRIVIEDDVWIGYGAIILSGVTIGRGSVIGAGAVVSENVPSYSIIVPERSRILRKRFTSEQITMHERELEHAKVFSSASSAVLT